jgi:hypothetical protein
MGGGGKRGKTVNELSAFGIRKYAASLSVKVREHYHLLHEQMELKMET